MFFAKYSASSWLDTLGHFTELVAIIQFEHQWSENTCLRLRLHAFAEQNQNIPNTLEEAKLSLYLLEMQDSGQESKNSEKV